MALAHSLSTLCVGAEYTLFTGPGQFSPNYNTVVQGLVPGDTIRFSDGRTFTVETILGNGSNTRVIGVNGGLAIRIPIRSQTVYQRVLDDFHVGSEILRRSGVPTVAVHSHLTGEFVSVERIQNGFTFSEFLQRQSQMSTTERARIWNEFVRFAADTSGLSSIGDFKRDGLMYSERTGWRLVDWQSHSFPTTHRNDSTVFDDPEFRNHVPPEILSRARAAIDEVRAGQGLTNRTSLVSRCLIWLFRLSR